MLLPHNNKHKIFLMAFIITVMVILLTASMATGRENGMDGSGAGRKVIIFLLDGLSLSDLKNQPNLRGLVNSSGLGLVNTRTRSLTVINRASNYLTMGMGVRIQVEEPADGYSIKMEPLAGSSTNNLGQIRNLDALKLNELVNRDYPNYTLGKIGEEAKAHGLKVALVGNADTDRPNHDSTLLAMDKSGIIPLGNISRSLTVKDPESAWGLRTDPEKLLSYSLEAVKLSDITVIDFGDTGRVGQAANRHLYDQKRIERLKDMALANADVFLGRLLKSVDLNSTVLVVVSPTPPVNEPSRLNTSLAPIIIYEKNKPPGVLCSDTTKRDGLVANIDLGPTVFARLGLDSKKMDFLGENMVTTPCTDNLGTVASNLAQYTTVKTARYLVHGAYVTLIVVSLVSLYISVFGGRKISSDRTVRALAVMVIAWPAVTLPLMAAAQMPKYFFYLALAVLITVGLGLLLSKTTDGALAGMGGLALITSLFLTFDALTGLKFLYHTPLGFNDVFSGGRYYGMNNDCMGILLGSTVYAMFYWFGRIGLSTTLRTLLGTGWLLAVIITQTPAFGANVGGTIAAMTTGTIAVTVLIISRPLLKRRVLATVLVVFIIELGIAYFDYRSGAHSHAGKVLGTLISQGFGQKFLEVLQSKAGLFAVMLALPPWNVLFGAELYLCHLFRSRMPKIRDEVGEVYPAQSHAFEVIFYSGLVAFAFNDTGIIATALIFTYMTMPLTAILATRTTIAGREKISI